MKNKEDIEIKCDHSISNGIIQLELEENKPLRIEISIHNLSRSEPRELLHCEMLKRIRVFQLDDQHKITESQATISIPPGRLVSRGGRVQSEPRELLHCEMLKRIRVYQLDDQHKITESQATISIPPGRLVSRGGRVQSEPRELLHCEMLKRIRVYQLDDQHNITESQATISIPPGRLFSRGERGGGGGVQSEIRGLLHYKMLKRIQVFQLDNQHKITESQATISIPPGRLVSRGEGGCRVKQ